jgi:preprotein translocase subunit SecE
MSEQPITTAMVVGPMVAFAFIFFAIADQLMRLIVTFLVGT